MRRGLQTEQRMIHKFEVKVGSHSVIVEQSELDDLIEALTEMRKLATDKALMNIGSA